MAFGSISVDKITDSEGSVFSPSSAVFRNRIINGDIRIDQRNAGANVTLSGSNQYPIDRFIASKDTSGATVTAEQSTTVPAGFTSSLLITVSTGASPGSTDENRITQRIEGLNCYDLNFGSANAVTITVSFWVRCSLTGTFSGSIRNGASNRSYPFTYTISVADTWEYKTATIAGDTSGTWLTTNGVGCQLTFDLGSGSSMKGTVGTWAGANYLGATGSTNLIETTGATLYITGVQLEVGSVATPFERRPYGTELVLCQRYYQKSYEYSIVPGTAVSADAKSLINAAWSYAAVNSIANGCASFQVTMRAAPTATVYDKAGNSAKMSTQSGTGTYTDDVAPNQIIASESNIIVQKYAQSCSGIAYAYTLSAEL
jgi:hypothetical protein